MSASRFAVPATVRSGRPEEPAFISGTSTEFLGRKPLPRAVRYRPLVFVLGPRSVGKTRVARHLLSEDARVLTHRELNDAATARVRTREWSRALLDPPSLLVEGPCFLGARPGYAKAVRELLALRVQAGRRTFVTESSAGTGLKELVDVVAPEQRATIVLRFPVGRGRRRYAARVCRELGIDTRHARSAAVLEPWTYDVVGAYLAGIQGG